MEKNPEITVIVPVYKVEEYLSQCLDSILSQTFTDFELLLIDDGSPDHCGEICEEYAGKDERIRVFHQENAGVSSARNRGLKEAQGRYVVFVDSDDYVLPKYLQDLYASRDELRGRGVVIETVTKIYPNKEVVLCPLSEMSLSMENYNYLLTKFTNEFIGYSASKLYDMTIIKQYQLSFLPNISLLEDFFFLLDYVLHADFVVTRNVSNYMYRVSHSVIAQSISSKTVEQEYSIFKNYRSRILSYKKKYNFSFTELIQIEYPLIIYLHRTLLSLYNSPVKLSYSTRIHYLKEIRVNNDDYIRDNFFPVYVADKIGKYFLIHHLYSYFDLWMRFLIKIKLKKMFGTNK